MANVKNGVKGPDGKQGMQGREIIAKVVAREEKNGTGYYMNAQLAQYNGSPAAKGNAQSQPQLVVGVAVSILGIRPLSLVFIRSALKPQTVVLSSRAYVLEFAISCSY